jgi:hypothetical protein
MKQEVFSNFLRGLNTDYKPVHQPEGTYRYFLNAIRRSNGDVFNESGTTEVFPTSGLKVFHSLVLDDDIIFFLGDGFTCQIGVLNEDDNFIILVDNPDLGFSLNFPIDAEARKNFKGERIVYFVDGKNVPRAINLDAIDFENSALFFTYTIPTIDLKGVVEEGSLPTGIYQFAARFVTGEGNSTSFGIPSNPIPIVDEPRSVGRDNYDGALPQTGSTKAIKFEVDNVDTKFEYLEIAVITYEGISNDIKINTLPLIPIQNRTSIPVTYNSTSQLRTELLLEQLVQEFASYSSAKHIAQKDGRLLLSNLTSSEIEVDFQKVANNIVLKYEVEAVEVPIELINIKARVPAVYEGADSGKDLSNTSTIYNDYKNETLTFDKKSYRRGEVYSFAIVPVFTNGQIGRAYHIPGNDKNTISTTSANVATLELGTYVSEEEYPDGFGYPGTNDSTVSAVNNKIRHHKMPTLEQRPHFTNAGDTYFVYILGVRVENVNLDLLGDDASKIAGWKLVRELRTDDKKSILAQGIAQPLGYAETTAPYNDAYVSPVAGQYPWFSATLTPPVTAQSTELGGNLVAFYSPESVIYEKDLSSATHIAKELTLNGRHHAVWGRVDSDEGRNDNYWHSFLNFTSYGNAIQGDKNPIDSSTIQYVPADNGGGQTGSFYKPNNVPITIWTDNTNGFLFFKLIGTALPVENPLINGRPEFMYYNPEGDSDVVYLHNAARSASASHIDPTVYDSVNKTVTGYAQRFLYNLYSTKNSQYGQIYDAQYVYVGYVNQNLEASKVFFNGDTFIGKIALTSKTRRREISGADVVLQEKYFTTSYFFVESDINVNYRHYITPSGENSLGTIPYYPKTKVFYDGTGNGLYEIPASFGHARGYNKQYSFENNLKTFFPKQLLEESVTDFSNRTIYSELAVEGEQLDAYRLFLPNNYHDIPKNKGEITDTFVLNNVFYIHTSKSLWRTYFNENTAIATSSGDVYLGSGGLFPRPSEEVITVGGGYAGTESKHAGCTTPYGRFFIDNNQGKVFLLSSGLDEISDKGLFYYFQDNIRREIDNPILNSGYTSFFDYANKRWVLCNTTESKNFTISYSPELNSWSSYHGYIFHDAVTRGNRTFLFHNNYGYVWELGSGFKGNFYGLQHYFRVEFVVNPAPNTTKSFDNISIHNTVRDSQKNIHLDTFDFIQTYDSYQNTGDVELVQGRQLTIDINDRLIKTKAELVNNEFRIAIPRNLVFDANLPIFEASNLVIHSNFDSNPQIRKFRDQIKDKYAIIKLVYTNENSYELDLHTVKTAFRIVSR